MLVRRILTAFSFVLPATLCTPALAEIPKLTPPMHVKNSDMYLDGGTISFEVVDARGEILLGCFDGRMRVVKEVYDDGPAHCYVGAQHPTQPGARALPLWGQEERELIHLLDEALNSDLSADARKKLAAIEYPGAALTDQRERSLCYILRSVEHRKQLLDCIDRGLPALPQCMTGYVGTSNPTRMKSVSRTRDQFEIVFVDRDGKPFSATLPADTTAGDYLPSSVQMGITMRAAFGSLNDRCLLTTILTASPPANRKFYDSLLDAARARIRHTFATDASR